MVLKGPLRSGEGAREGRGLERKWRRGAGRRKREGEESWNRAADWLRPALLITFFSVDNCLLAIQHHADIHSVQ